MRPAILITIVTAGLLAGCGQKGPLYLPTPAPGQASSSDNHADQPSGAPYSLESDRYSDTRDDGSSTDMSGDTDTTSQNGSTAQP